MSMASEAGATPHHEHPPTRFELTSSSAVLSWMTPLSDKSRRGAQTPGKAGDCPHTSRLLGEAPAARTSASSSSATSLATTTLI